MNDIYETKDKQIAPFLFIQEGVDFIGTRISNNIVYFQFSPLQKCSELSNLLISGKAPLVQAKDLFNAIETYRDRVFEMKDVKNERYNS